MSDGKLSQAETYQNLKRETEIIGQAHDLLMTGRFPGGAAMQLATCQGYLKGLYAHMKAETEKLAPLPLPEDKPVVAQAEALPSDSIKPSQPVPTEAKQ